MLIPVFLISHLIPSFANTSCDIWVKIAKPTVYSLSVVTDVDHLINTLHDCKLRKFFWMKHIHKNREVVAGEAKCVFSSRLQLFWLQNKKVNHQIWNISFNLATSFPFMFVLRRHIRFQEHVNAVHSINNKIFQRMTLKKKKKKRLHRFWSEAEQKWCSDRLTRFSSSWHKVDLFILFFLFYFWLGVKQQISAEAEVELGPNGPNTARIFFPFQSCDVATLQGTFCTGRKLHDNSWLKLNSLISALH